MHTSLFNIEFVHTSMHRSLFCVSSFMIESHATHNTHVTPYPDSSLYINTRKLLEATEWYTDEVVSLNPESEEKEKLEEDKMEEDDFEVGGNPLLMPPFDMVVAAQRVYPAVLYADSYAGKTWKVDPQPAAPAPSSSTTDPPAPD